MIFHDENNRNQCFDYKIETRGNYLNFIYKGKFYILFFYKSISIHQFISSSSNLNLFFFLIMPIQWEIPETDLLMNERMRRNMKYHYTTGRNRVKFWKSIVRKIYHRYHIRYMARQCEIRWRNLRNDYTVSKNNDK